MPSPICEVKDGAGAYGATTTGVNVTPANTITIRLSDSSVQVWSIECVDTDDLSVAATVTSSLVIDSVLKTATFTAPVAGRAYIFRSRIESGIGPNGATDEYETTFGIYTLAGTNQRTHGVNEKLEGGPFGWSPDVNAIIRNPTARNGTAQTRKYEFFPAAVTTTDATVTTLTSYTMSDETMCYFTVIVTAARLTNVTKAAAYERRVAYRRTGGAAPTIIGSLVSGTDQETDAGMNVTIDVSSNDVRVRVTGVAANSLRWGCSLVVQEQV